MEKQQDIIFIEELAISTTIGVHAWEQETKQIVQLSLRLTYDTSAAANTDDLALTIDYQQLSQALEKFVGQQNCALIETLANRVANFLLTNWPITWLHLTVYKPDAIANAKTVGISIERTHCGRSTTQ